LVFCCAAQGWCDKNYIYTAGYHARLLFRSSKRPSGPPCVHDCYILAGGAFAPRPTFRIVASDRPLEPIDAKSTSGCILAVQMRINEALDKAPKTASSGPQIFGLRATECVAGIEALDVSKRCAAYWAARGAAAVGGAAAAGVRQRASAATRMAGAVAAAAAARARGGAAGAKRKRDVSFDEDDDEVDGSDDDDSEEGGDSSSR
jgi:hypothetical protein